MYRQRMSHRADPSACVFCKSPLDDGRPTSYDHIFGKAFGGRLTVRCCQRCNSFVGHDVEAPMHAPDSVLSFARAGAELPGKPLRGKYKSDGTAVNIYRGLRGAVPRDPEVTVREEDGLVSAQVGGTEEQAKRVWRGLRKRYGDTIPEWEDILQHAKRTKGPSPPVEIALRMDLKAAYRFAAKVALAGGAAVWGDEFAISELADSLRQILHAPDGRFDPSAITIQQEYLAKIVEVAQGQVPVDLPDIRVPAPGDPEAMMSQLTFAPAHLRGLENPSTVIFVHILNFAVPLQGIVVQGRVPGDPVLPVVIREPLRGGVAIWKLDQIFFDALDALSEDG